VPATTFTDGDAAAARRYDTWFDTGWGTQAWAVETRAVLAALGPIAGCTVADVGCGTGRLTDLLAATGAFAVGVDLDPAMLTVAAGRAPGRIIRADAARLPLADASVDAAVTVATLEFTDDAGTVLAEMARVTRPGGRVVAAVLNPTSLWGLLDRPTRHDPYQRGCFLDRAELLRLGRRHGRARLAGALSTAGRLPLRDTVSPLLERAGRLAPRCGAVQILTVEVGR
jgi:SAM-dependent methyltransferase